MSLLSLFQPPTILRRVIVNLKSGTAFRGVIRDERGGYLILVNAELLSDRGTRPASGPTSLDGEVLVQRADVDFLQAVS